MDEPKQDVEISDAVGNIGVEEVEDEHESKRNDTAVEAKTTVAASPSASSSGTIQALTDKTLHFLSHASNETLGACLVGLGATTYLVFGRVGLVFIGFASGVVLHATWEGIRNDDRDEATKQQERERRRETGVEVARRVLDWRSNRILDSEDDRVYVNQTLDYSAFEPKTSKALATLTDHVIRDYVHYWYDWSLPGEQTFPASCRQTWTAFVLSISNHLQRKRPADAFLDFVTNASSITIVFLTELSAALNASPNAQPSDAVDTYLTYKPDGSLSYLLNREAQDAKLKDAAEDMLQAYLDPKAYNFPPSHLFLKEVLAQLILGYTVTTCSKPEWINEWIVYLLEESQTTKEVMEIVDAGVEGKADVLEKTTSVEQKEANGEHRRKLSRAEEAMDEAMKEAKRLTQLMIAEDERRAREEPVASSENISEVSNAQDTMTPTSSQSDIEHQESDTAKAQLRENPSSARDSGAGQADIQAGTALSSTDSPTNQFLSFDQLQPEGLPTSLSDDWSASNPLPTPPIQGTLTLLNASISIFDDAVPGEKGTIKAKPQIDYLVQIEPASSMFPGWMIARKYADFENLHEVLRRISIITGVTGFAETHNELPKWKGSTKAELRRALEVYLMDAVKYQPLAESEGMKRFLEKDQGMSKSPSGKGAGFGWKLGDNMINAISKAPLQVAGGGKAVLGGVAGGGKAVFGGVAGLVGATGVVGSGAKKQSGVNRTSTGSSLDVSHKASQSVATLNGYAASTQSSRQSQDSLRIAPSKPSLDRSVSGMSVTSTDVQSNTPPTTSRSSLDGLRTSTHDLGTIGIPTITESTENLANLPPPPSEMPADYGTPSQQNTRMSIETHAPADVHDSAAAEQDDMIAPPKPPRPTQATTKPEAKQKAPLTDIETSVAVELMFAMITELYTLSSAWNFRRTLLTAAKTFLLRPGNPQLAAIRDLLQSSLLDANLSDEGMAAHIYKLRENALPTAEELEQWKIDYPEKSEEQKEELRKKARKLLVQKGMPAALQSVMGAAASGEALGKVFDCLQVERVSRGLIFGLIWQALKIVTQ